MSDRLLKLIDAVQGRVWYYEHGPSTVLVDEGEWTCWHVEIFEGDDPLACAYGETEEMARDRAEVIVRALGRDPPERIQEGSDG